nr:MAG TPA: hypothetical protein [Crassvirales sp.]
MVVLIVKRMVPTVIIIQNITTSENLYYPELDGVIIQQIYHHLIMVQVQGNMFQCVKNIVIMYQVVLIGINIAHQNCGHIMRKTEMLVKECH